MKPPAANLTADVVVYGATPSGVCAAIAAKRMGRSVRIIGGWRENRLGGMITGGLGEADISDVSALGGIGKEFYQRYWLAEGNDDYRTRPSIAQQVFDAFVAEEGIPVTWSRGVVTCAKDGAKLLRIGTRCGLSVSARVFIDASYEGDLLTAAGATMRYGRESAAEYGESLAGRLPPLSPHTYGGVIVDPWRVPNTPSSGLLPGIRMPVGALGDADNALQAYNFRLTMTTTKENGYPLPTAPPPGFDPARFEPLLRYLAAQTSLGKSITPYTQMNISPIPGPDLWDVNAKSAFGTDDFGGSWVYRTPNIQRREAAWKDCEMFTRGLWWVYWGHRDSRVPQGLRDQMRNWRWARIENDRPAFGDQPGWPHQLYVREYARLAGLYTLRQSDVLRPDSDPVPYADEVIAQSAYTLDRHHVQRYADNSTGTWRIQNEGNFYIRSGGANYKTPMPYSILCPRRHELTNVLSAWCVSTSSASWGSVRMEPIAMCLGHACGVAAALATATGSTAAMQDVSMPELRAALLAQGAALT